MIPARTLTRRRFLSLAAGLIGAAALPIRAQDWADESPLIESIRSDLQTYIGGLNMALDFRCIDRDLRECFRIQINADNLMPVASCFKAFAVLYYYLNTQPESWQDDENSALYRMTVYSDNGATGVVLADVAGRVPGDGNAIIKFNDFLRGTMGLRNGLHTWNHTGSPTVGMSDLRFAPSAVNGRVVRMRGQEHQVDNVFTAADLARGHDYIWRGEFFTQSETFRRAAQATKALLSIPATRIGYVSPIERVYPRGYMGKDGILPSDMIATGRVVNDAGVLSAGDDHFIISFMSAGESESTALAVLAEVVRQMGIYETLTASAS